MKILVTYYSKTGNTRKVAEAIQDALDGKSVSLVPIEEAQEKDGYALILCGFPVHAHSVPLPVQNYIKNLKAGQKLALFSTHGSLRDGRMPKEAIENAIGIAKDAKILGSFTCRGQVESEIIDALMNKPEHMAWATEATSANGHPDKIDLDDARSFALDMAKKAQNL
jgi:flavodoxin